MKKLSFSVVALIASIVMLTSCLGNGGNRRSGIVWGYVDHNSSFIPLLYHRDFNYPIYSSELKDYISVGYIPTFVTAYVEIEESSTENQNAAANQFLYGSISSIATLKDYVEAQGSLDTTRIIEDELLLSVYGSQSFVKNYMFLQLIFEEYQQYQENDYYMTFDMDQELQNVSGNQVIDVYLRAGLKAEGKGDVLKNTGPVLVLNMQEIRDRMKHKYENADTSNGYYVHFRINTVKGFDKETGERTGWVTSETFSIPVYPESN